MADVSIIVDKNGTEFAIADTTARADASAAAAKIESAETSEIKDESKLVESSAVWKNAVLRVPQTSTVATRPASSIIARSNNIISLNIYFDKSTDNSGLSLDVSETGITFYILNARGIPIRQHSINWAS